MGSWFILKNGQQSGPVNDSQLKLMAKEGEISKETLVQKKGMTSPVRAAKIKGLDFGHIPPELPDAKNESATEAENPYEESDQPSLLKKMKGLAASTLSETSKKIQSIHQKMKSAADDADKNLLDRVATSESQLKEELEAGIDESAIPNWAPPTVDEFIAAPIDCCKSLLSRCEQVRDFSVLPEAKLAATESVFLELQQGIQNRLDYVRKRTQEIQKASIETESMKIETKSTIREIKSLRSRIRQAEEDGNTELFASLNGDLERLESSIPDDDLRTTLEKLEKQKELVELEKKYVRLIESITEEIGERILSLQKEARSQQLAADRRAAETAGQDFFSGLNNKNAESFGNWYLRFFGRFIRMPVYLSFPLQLVIWMFFGFVWIPITFFVGKLNSCPKCGLLFARKLDDKQVVAAADDVATVTMKDAHYNSEGKNVGSTHRQQQVQVRRQLVRLHYSCKFCGNRWDASQVEQWQK